MNVSASVALTVVLTAVLPFSDVSWLQPVSANALVIINTLKLSLKCGVVMFTLIFVFIAMDNSSVLNQGK